MDILLGSSRFLRASGAKPECTSRGQVMKEKSAYVGLDVHKDTVALGALETQEVDRLKR
jgi:hypothetical protein